MMLALCLGPRWSRVLALFALHFVIVNAEARHSSALIAPAEIHARERVAVLRAEIAEADELYFKKAAPMMSDAAYDRLKRELAELERTFPDAAAEGMVVNTIGDDRSGLFPVAHHRERMLSLRKSYTEFELRSFHESTVQRLQIKQPTFLVEPKYDGLAISVTFVHGQMVRAVTRGDGDQGDDVTANVRTIPSLPRALRLPKSEPANANADSQSENGCSVPDLIELRGEVFIGFAEFDRINAEQEKNGGELFANARNLAAGTLKQHDPAQVARRKLEIVFYGIGACEPEAARPKSQQALHAAIRAWGLPGVDNVQVVKNADEMWAAVAKIGRDRERYAYPTDGAVVKLDDVTAQRQMGAALDAPKWAMAFKFAPLQGTTRVSGITVQVGRTGLLTPVAELEPVSLGGSTITRATLHNFAEIRRRDIRVGDWVVIEKAGEIIPAIAEVNCSRRSANLPVYRAPAVCPSCAASVVQLPGEVAVRCPNSTCPAQLRRRLAHFAGPSGVAIEGLGPAAMDALVEAGVLKNVADLYRLREIDFKGLRGVSTDRVLASIERSKHAALWRFVNGLSIAGVGEVSAKALARQFEGLAKFAGAERATYFQNDRCVVPGVPVAAAEAALAFFEQPMNRSLVKALIAAGVAPNAP